MATFRSVSEIPVVTGRPFCAVPLSERYPVPRSTRLAPPRVDDIPPRVYNGSMELATQKREEIVVRLRRVEGQLRGIQRMLDEGRDCADVVTQFAAAERALEQAAFKFFGATMAQCAEDPDGAALAGYTAEKLERMFLRLA